MPIAPILNPHRAHAQLCTTLYILLPIVSMPTAPMLNPRRAHVQPCTFYLRVCVHADRAHARPCTYYLCVCVCMQIVPMLNPDGVINGSYRCSLAGVDLNRWVLCTMWT